MQEVPVSSNTVALLLRMCFVVARNEEDCSRGHRSVELKEVVSSVDVRPRLWNDLPKEEISGVCTLWFFAASLWCTTAKDTFDGWMDGWLIRVPAAKAVATSRSKN
jgi:hypothetical protein